MAYNVSNKYKQIIYSGDARNRLKLLFNNVELPNADLYCEKLVVRSRIVPNGSKVFSLNNFVSKEADLILHDIDTSILQDQVSISIGTLVDDDYEYVPIGIFNIQDQPTNDKNKTTIKLRDNSVKFDFNYNAQPLIDENGGSATKLQILQDICTQANVTCNITSFLGYLDEIGVYDNTITARQYIANIAEQAGKIATINRDGELIFIDLNNLTTWEIPIEIVEKYENGTKFKIGKVVYEDGIVRYETPDSNDDTLFLDGSNNYINNDLNLAEASSTNNNYVLDNTGDSELAYLKLEGKTTQETRSGRNLYNYKDTNAYVTTGITVDDEGWISVTYDNTSGSSIAYFNYWTNNLNLQTNTNYNIITEIKSVSGSGALFPMSNLNSSGQFLDYIAYGFDGISNNDVIAQIKTTKDNFTYIGDGLRTFIQFDVGQSGSITFRISVLEDTTITPTSFVYEPYGAMPSPEFPSELVSVGYRNLFDSSTFVAGDVVGANANIRLSSRQKQYINAGTYTFSTNLDLTTYNYAIAIIPSTPPSASYNDLYNSGWLNTNTKTITLNVSGYLCIYLRKSDNSTLTVDNISSYWYQFEKSTQHSYIPYGKYGIEVKTSDNNNNNNTYVYTLDNPLRSIGNTRDLLFIKNGMLYVDRKIGNVILDGSESWTRQNNNRFWLVREYWNDANVPKNPISSEIQGLYCNRFQEVTMNQTWLGVEGISYDNENTTQTPVGSTFDISCNSVATTIEEFVNWLTNNNVEVEYLLQNPYIEELGKVQIPSTYTPSTTIQINTFLDTNTYIKYREKETKLESILNETNMFNIDSLKTGKILGNPAIDSYDLIKIVDNGETYTTLATNELTYTGVMINTFDTQIGEEAKEQNVFVNGEETFKKWARTKIDNVEGAITLQAGRIDETNGRIDQTTLDITSQGALLNVIANNSNIDVSYDENGNPISGEVREVTTTTGFKFNAEGMTIEDSSSNFKALHRNTGTYYLDGNTIVGQYTKDGSKQKDLDLFGIYTYGKNDINDTPMFIAQLFTDSNGEEGFGHFYNRGD